MHRRMALKRRLGDLSVVGFAINVATMLAIYLFSYWSGRDVAREALYLLGQQERNCPSAANKLPRGAPLWDQAEALLEERV
jgi:hypothetical protein